MYLICVFICIYQIYQLFAEESEVLDHNHMMFEHFCLNVHVNLFFVEIQLSNPFHQSRLIFYIILAVPVQYNLMLALMKQ